MRKQKLVGMVLLCGMIVFAGCGHKHVWVEATCEMPKHCVECEDTEGNVLEHAWKDATCTLAKSCEACGATEGEALGHSFLAATCVSAEECEVCGEMKGEPLAHGGKTIGNCDLCGEPQNKNLVLTIGYRHEVAANSFLVALNEALQELNVERQELNKLGELTETDSDLETIFIGEHSLATLTLREYLDWSDEVVREVLWEKQAEKYEEVKSVYEEVYLMCADYPELRALKEKTKVLIDLVPLTPPEKRERTGDVYDKTMVELIFAGEEEQARAEEATNRWVQDMQEDISWLLRVGTDMKAWQEEYDKVKALFE